MKAPHELGPCPEIPDSVDAAAKKLAELIDVKNRTKQTYLRAQLQELITPSKALLSVTAADPASSRTTSAHSIESACQRILSAFDISERDFELSDAVNVSPIAAIIAFQVAEIVRSNRRHHSPLEDKQSRDQVEAILEGIVILRDAARRAREQAEAARTKGAGGRRRSKDWPIEEISRHILGLYVELTGRRPGVSKSPKDGKRGGPAVRFLDFSLRWLGWSVKPSTAANLIDNLKNDEVIRVALDNPIFKIKSS